MLCSSLFCVSEMGLTLRLVAAEYLPVRSLRR